MSVLEDLKTPELTGDNDINNGFTLKLKTIKDKLIFLALYSHDENVMSSLK